MSSRPALLGNSAPRPVASPGTVRAPCLGFGFQSCVRAVRESLAAGCGWGKSCRSGGSDANHDQCVVDEGRLFLKSWKVLRGETEQDWYFRVPRAQCGLRGQTKRRGSSRKCCEEYLQRKAELWPGLAEVMVAEVGSGLALVGLAKRAGQRGKRTGPAGWPCGAGLLMGTRGCPSI